MTARQKVHMLRCASLFVTPAKARVQRPYRFPAFAGTTSGCRIESGMTMIDLFTCLSNYYVTVCEGIEP
jgi:hypothetical protein